MYRQYVQCTGTVFKQVVQCTDTVCSLQASSVQAGFTVYRQDLQCTGRVYNVQAGFTVYRQDLQCTGRIYSVQAGYKGTLATVVPPVCPMQSGVYGQEMAAYLCLLQRYD